MFCFTWYGPPPDGEDEITELANRLDELCDLDVNAHGRVSIYFAATGRLCVFKRLPNQTLQLENMNGRAIQLPSFSQLLPEIDAVLETVAHAFPGIPVFAVDTTNAENPVRVKFIPA